MNKIIDHMAIRMAKEAAGKATLDPNAGSRFKSSILDKPATVVALQAVIAGMEKNKLVQRLQAGKAAKKAAKALEVKKADVATRVEHYFAMVQGRA
jgi:hypothetical protein